MEAVCRSESSGASKALELVLMSMAESVAVEALLAAGKSLTWLLFVMSSISGERSELGEPVKGSPLLSHGKKSCTSVPENKDDGESEDDEEDDEDDEDEFDPADDVEEKEFTGDEGVEEDGDDGDDHEANGEGGSDDDDEDEEDVEDEEDEDDEDEDEDDEDEEDQPPSKKRK